MIDDKGLYDIYGLSCVPFFKTYWFYTLVSLFVLSFALYVGYLFFRVYRRQTIRSTPYWEQATAQLLQLQLHLPIGHNKKIFYTTLTKILKFYLSHHYHESYQSKTDNEVFEHLSLYSVVLPPGVEVTSLFHRVTPVKFARSYEKELEMVLDVQRALLFIEKTAPQLVKKGYKRRWTP